MTGRYADGWIPSLGYAPAERLTAMRDTVLAAARDAGRSPEEITCALNVEVHVGDEVAPAPDLLAGSAEQVADRLHGLIEMGFTAFNVMPVGDRSTEQVDRIAADVLPKLRAAA